MAEFINNQQYLIAAQSLGETIDNTVKNRIQRLASVMDFSRLHFEQKKFELSTMQNLSNARIGVLSALDKEQTSKQSFIEVQKEALSNYEKQQKELDNTKPNPDSKTYDSDISAWQNKFDNLSNSIDKFKKSIETLESDSKKYGETLKDIFNVEIPTYDSFVKSGGF